MDKERVPIKVQKTLEGCSLGELQFFANVASKKDFPKMIDFINRQVDNEKGYIFGLSEENPQRLAVEKAFSRGQVAGLKNLVYILRRASNELEIRLTKK